MPKDKCSGNFPIHLRDEQAVLPNPPLRVLPVRVDSLSPSGVIDVGLQIVTHFVIEGGYRVNIVFRPFSDHHTHRLFCSFLFLVCVSRYT